MAESGNVVTVGSESAGRASLLHRAARGSVLNFAGAIVSALATFALTAVVTRLSPSQSDAGVFFAATSLFLIASSLGALGTANGLVYFISGARGRGELETASVYVRISLLVVPAVAVLSAAALLFWAEPLAAVVGASRVDEFAQFVRVMAFAIPLAAVGNIAMSATRGLGTMKPTAALDQVVRPLLQLLLVGIVLLAGLHTAISWAWALGYLPVAVLAWLWWSRMRADLPEQIHGIPRGYQGRFWRFSGPRALAGLAQISMQRLDIVLVGALAGLAAAAVYTAATRFLVLGQMAARAVSQSVQPLLGELLARGDHPEAKRLYQASTAWLVLVSWPIYLVLIVFGPVVLQIFGAEYAAGSDVLLLLCATMLVATACGMVDVVLIMAGKATWNLANVLASFVVMVGLDLWLIPQLGILGAAIGWSASILVGNLVPLVQVWHALRLHPFGRATLVAFALSALSFGVVPVLVRLVMGETWWALLVGGALACLVGAVGLWRFRRLLQLPVLLRAIRGRRGRKGAGAGSDLSVDVGARTPAQVGEAAPGVPGDRSEDEQGRSEDADPDGRQTDKR